MFRLAVPSIGAFIALALWIYCIFDVIATDEMLARNLPKGMWLIIVIFLPTIGALAWLLLGRPLYAGWRPGDTEARPPRPVRGPEDDARFDDHARLKAWEAELRRREAELEKKEGGDDEGEEGGDGFTFRW